MDNTDKLIFFLKKKNALLKYITGMDYIDQEDLNEIIDLWSTYKCEEVWKRLHINAKRNAVSLLLGTNSCPWCIAALNCSRCGYGERHGRCNDESEDTRFHKIDAECTRKTNTYLKKIFSKRLVQIIKSIGKC